jgi:HrpA-like RNA helicase
MPLPTMLLPGKVKIFPHMSDYEKNKINTLPAKDYILDWFAKRIPVRRGGIPMIKPTGPGDRILIVRSGTGSGKSTTFPPELYLRFNDAVGKNIAVTQPRILTAVSITADIIEFYPDFKLGDNIGYQTSLYTYKPKKGIVFMTIGTLTQQLKVMSDEEFMQKYSFIIIDECHDRSTEMDLALGLAKQLIHRNYKHSACPFLILTSATFDVEKYSKFFGTDMKQIIDVEGLNYPIEAHFPTTDIANYTNAAVQTALDIHKNNTSDYEGGNRFTDILIFVYGGMPLQAIISALTKANAELKGNHFVPLKLTGTTYKKGDRDYQNIFKPLRSINVMLGKEGTSGKIVVPNRRIIVSTNVAETGVTIDTLKYVIDTGYENFMMFNPSYVVSGLVAKSITRASAMQRKGRAGRRAPGVWYPLYTEETFNAMASDKFPDIISDDISDFLLGIIVKTVHPEWDGVISSDVDIGGTFSIDKIDLLDMPAIDSIMYALEKLYVLGLINHNYVPTVMGLAATSVTRIDAESMRMIMAGYQYGANVLDLITIAAFMYARKWDYIDRRAKKKYSYSSVFQKDEKQLPYYDKLFIADDFIQCIFIWEDFMEQVQIMKEKLSIKHVKKWCKENGLVYTGLLRVIEQRDDLLEAFIQSIGLDPFYNGLNLKRHSYSLRSIFRTDFSMGMSEVAKLKSCIYEGFRLNMCTWDPEKRTYFSDATNTRVKPFSDAIKSLPSHESFVQQRPKKIIVRNVRMEENRFNGMYQFETNRVSVMDGYVLIDETFIYS